jgi:ABC-2 type transport system ATP-binding protein
VPTRLWLGFEEAVTTRGRRADRSAGERMSLELISITRRFGREVVLDHLDLCVRRGDCYGFIGHNGAGKTTTMRIALGLQRADSGRVLVDGFDALDHPREARARMSGLIETPGFHGHASGLANLIELACLQGLSRTAARSEALVQIGRVGLDHAAERPVREYSQGMRQRLGIAQALLGEPAYVLLDEPTNGLDPEGIADVRALVRRLVRDDGLTVLVSSHQLHELTGLCNRIAVLQRGRLLIEEETDKLLDDAGTRYRLSTPDAEIAHEVLARLAITHRARSDGTIELALRTDDAPRAAAELVNAGVRLAGFAAESTTLEEIYLRLAQSEPRRVESSSARPVVDRSASRAAAAPTAQRAPPRPLALIYGYEMRRLVPRAGVAFLFVLPALLAAAAVAWRAAQARADARAIAGEKLFSATDVTAFEGVGIAIQAGLPLLTFIALGIASQSISSELASGTLRNVLLRPFRRSEIVLGKVVASLCVVLGGYLVLAIAALAAARACFEFRDVSEILPNGARYALVPASELWPALRAALAAPILPLAAYTVLGFLAGTVVRGAATGLALALFLGVALDLLRVVARAFQVEGGLLSAYLPSPLGDTSAIRAFVESAQGISNTHFAFATTAYLVPLAWLALALAISMVVLTRRSIP